MKFKKVGIFLMAASMCALLAGCGGGKISDKEIILKAGFSTGASDPRVISTELFKEEVEKATDGRIKIEIYPDSQLGADSDLIKGVVNGEVDITASSAGNFAMYDTNVGISAMPFLFDGFDEAWDFVDGELEETAEKNLPDFNIKVLAHYDNGFRCVTTSESFGPINSVSDMNGLNIRTPENQIVMETMLLLDAKPKVLPFNELKDALAKGEFDAQENPIPVIYNNGLYEVQKNLAITNHSYDVMLFVIRQDVWDDLSEADKKILHEAALKAQEKDRELIRKQTEDFVSALEDAGMNITYPDLDEFRDATSEAFDIFKNSYDAELLSKVLN